MVVYDLIYICRQGHQASSLLCSVELKTNALHAAKLCIHWRRLDDFFTHEIFYFRLIYTHVSLTESVGTLFANPNFICKP